MGEHLENQILLRYLPQYSPEMWHQIAMSWNWDNGYDVLRWIISQPICDKGTALLLYWRSSPRYMVQYATKEEVNKYEIENYEFVKEIENKYVSGFFQNENFEFDPQHDDGTDWTTTYSEYPLKQPIPEIMYQATKGSKLVRLKLEEGYPPEVLAEAEKASKGVNK